MSKTDTLGLLSNECSKLHISDWLTLVDSLQLCCHISYASYLFSKTQFGIPISTVHDDLRTVMIHSNSIISTT